MQPIESQAAERPEPGLAKGRWEAPSWVFWSIALVTIALGAGWAAKALQARIARTRR